MPDALSGGGSHSGQLRTIREACSRIEVGKTMAAIGVGSDARSRPDTGNSTHLCLGERTVRSAVQRVLAVHARLAQPRCRGRGVPMLYRAPPRWFWRVTVAE